MFRVSWVQAKNRRFDLFLQRARHIGMHRPVVIEEWCRCKKNVYRLRIDLVLCHKLFPDGDVKSGSINLATDNRGNRGIVSTAVGDAFENLFQG